MSITAIHKRMNEAKHTYRRTFRRSCSTPSIGFLSCSYMQIGGTETFHQTLIPRLRTRVNVVGFVATKIYGGDGAKLGVPYATGLRAARELASVSDVLVTWGIDCLGDLVPQNRPKIISVHHSDPTSEWSNNITLSQLHLIDEIVCVNKDASQHLSSSGKPTHYIPNSIDPARIRPSGRQSGLRAAFGIRSDAKIVLFGHRLSAEKRPELAVEIARQLPDDWVLVIVGDGAERANIESLAKECGRVRVVGRCESLADWLAISNCFLSLSTFDGFGLSLAEAMLANVPTVSTPTGIAPGLAITLPIESSASEWATAIVNSSSWVPDPNMAIRFSVDRMVSRWADVLTTH